MNQTAGKTEFVAALKDMFGLSNSIKYKNIDYLLLFGLGEDDESLIITVTDGINFLWAKELDYNDFNQLRKKIGLEGAYQNYFQLFKEAVMMVNGSFKIEIQPNNNDLDFTVYYKINKTATLTGLINIGTPITFEQDNNMFRQFIKKSLFDVQNSKKRDSTNLEKEVFELKEKLKTAEDKIVNLSKNIPNVSVVVNHESEPKQEQQKRKPKNDLINPNIRKRKGVGAKIGGE